jgi:hypothetical protein
MSRQLQITSIEQKIERLQAQLDYLRKIESLEQKQDKEVKTKEGNSQS